MKFVVSIGSVKKEVAKITIEAPQIDQISLGRWFKQAEKALYTLEHSKTPKDLEAGLNLNAPKIRTFALDRTVTLTEKGLEMSKKNGRPVRVLATPKDNTITDADQEALVKFVERFK